MKNALISLYALLSLGSCCDTAKPIVQAPKKESEIEQVISPIILQEIPLLINLTPQVDTIEQPEEIK